jgi:hypothetical protein
VGPLLLIVTACKVVTPDGVHLRSRAGGSPPACVVVVAKK